MELRRLPAIVGTILENFLCPSCGKEVDEYRTDTDTLICRSCKMSVARELALDMSRGEPLWLTEDKRCMRIRDMETSHIQHCVGMIFSKNNGWRGRFMKPLIEELKRRHNG